MLEDKTRNTGKAAFRCLDKILIYIQQKMKKIQFAQIYWCRNIKNTIVKNSEQDPEKCSIDDHHNNITANINTNDTTPSTSNAVITYLSLLLLVSCLYSRWRRSIFRILEIKWQKFNKCQLWHDFIQQKYPTSQKATQCACKVKTHQANAYLELEHKTGKARVWLRVFLMR